MIFSTYRFACAYAAFAAAGALCAADYVDFNRNGKKDVFEDASRPVEKRVENLVAQMTREEKIGQLNQPYAGADNKLDKQVADLAAGGGFGTVIWVGTDVKVRNECQRIAVEKSRLGIPVMFCLDVIHGAKTVFPIAPALAGSFEPWLFERAQAVAAAEARAVGIDLSFAPMCDNPQDARWGRVAETCGEDPYLAGLCVAAQVRGFQGDDRTRLPEDRVAACLKHYVGYGASIGGRDYNETEISLWTLRNQHLPQFHAGVNAGALAVMSSFNAIGGQPSVSNPFTLDQVLRKEWGFDGFVVSDWNGVSEQISWGFAADPSDAAAKALNAGNDIDMVSGAFAKGLSKAIDEGRVKASTLDEAVKRVLRVKFAVGLFERPYVDDGLAARVAARASEAEKLAVECAEKSVVLAKNDGTLPLKPEVKRVALLGPMAVDRSEPLGCWVPGGFNNPCRTLAEALGPALGEGVKLVVEKGCDAMSGSGTLVKTDGTVVSDGSEASKNGDNLIARAVAAAKEAEIVVMAIGESRGWTGENTSRSSLGLTGRQQELFDKVAAVGKPIVAILYCGRPLAVPAVWEKAAAVMYAWQPGSFGGTALANLLTGKASPSARFCVSVPRDVSVVPVNYNHLVTGRPTSGAYREFGNERAWAEGYEKYAFGYGLTYTKFAYSGERIDGDEAVATVTNVGTREGIETVQLYVRQVVCSEGARPVRELRGFRRVALKPGEKADVRFKLDAVTLGYVTKDGGSRADKGAYRIWIAPSSKEGRELAFRRN